MYYCWHSPLYTPLFPPVSAISSTHLVFLTSILTLCLRNLLTYNLDYVILWIAANMNLGFKIDWILLVFWVAKSVSNSKRGESYVCYKATLLNVFAFVSKYIIFLGLKSTDCRIGGDWSCAFFFLTGRSLHLMSMIFYTWLIPAVVWCIMSLASIHSCRK
jgi:hypothetical protein